jgi:hypothetical protein
MEDAASEPVGRAASDDATVKVGIQQNAQRTTNDGAVKQVYHKQQLEKSTNTRGKFVSASSCSRNRILHLNQEQKASTRLHDKDEE